MLNQRVGQNLRRPSSFSNPNNDIDRNHCAIEGERENQKLIVDHVVKTILYVHVVHHRMFSSINVLRNFVILLINRSSSAETVSKALDSKRLPVGESGALTSGVLVRVSG